MSEFLKYSAANPGRSAHRLALQAEQAVQRSRQLLCELLGIDEPQRLIFTLNCTDALNIAIKGLLNESDHVVTTTLEHNSVLRPLQRLAEAGYISYTKVAVGSDGIVDPDDIVAAITPQTRLIITTHASNVLGTIQPIAEIGRLVREQGCVYLVDAAQTAGVVDISLGELDVDLLAVPGHKSLLGPTGTGTLYVGPRVTLRPWREGGTGGDSISLTQPRELPYLLEAGTPNTIGIVGLQAGVEYVMQQGAENILQHERTLIGHLIEQLSGDDHIRLLGPCDMSRMTGIVSLVLKNTTAVEAAAVLDESFGIAVRAGLHCAPSAHRQAGTFPEGTIRVSPGPFNTEQDIADLVRALRAIARM